MEYSKVIDHTMNEFEEAAADEVYEAIQEEANGTERSAQQQAFRLGMSNIGHCQNAAVLMIRQTPPTDVRDKTAAFIGTELGKAIERRMKLRHPGWLFQSEAIFQIPSGGELGSHPDIAVPAREGVSAEEFIANRKAIAEGADIPKAYVQGVWDLKSKDKLDVIKQYGPSKQQVFQLSGYADALTKTLLLMDPATGEVTGDPKVGVPMQDADGNETGEMVLDGTKPIWLTDVYFDRSGSQHEAYSFGWWYDPAVLLEIDDWIHDLKYAVVNGSEGSKDKPREWCWNWCEYATLCRGNDTDAEGLIEDPAILSTIHLYAEAQKAETAAAKLKKTLKPQIPADLSGSTGTHTVRWLEVGPTVVKEQTRLGYRKLDIRPVPGPKKPPAPRKKKAAVEAPVEAEVQA